MAAPNWIGGLIGGALIGLASVLLLLFNGRLAGVSGMIGGLVGRYPASERWWRLAFLFGIVVGSAAYAALRGLPVHMQSTGITVGVAGFLVGVGTRLGSGCTSGHGVCGLARRSKRSLVATLTFIATAMLTVFITRHLFHLP